MAEGKRRTGKCVVGEVFSFKIVWKYKHCQIVLCVRGLRVYAFFFFFFFGGGGGGGGGSLRGSRRILVIRSDG